MYSYILRQFGSQYFVISLNNATNHKAEETAGTSRSQVIHGRNGGYGNMGGRVFKGGYKIRKNQHPQRKLLIFENWISGGLRSFQKSEF